MVRKKKKYKNVYRKNYKPKVSRVKKVKKVKNVKNIRKSKFIRKLDTAAQKYDEFLESTREKGRGIKSEFIKAKDVIVPRVQETGEMVGGVVRPVGEFFQRAGRGIKEGVSLTPHDYQSRRRLPKLWRG